MFKILVYVKRNLIWVIPLVMVAGLAFGYFFEPALLKTLILPFTFVMVYPMMVTIQYRALTKGHDWKLQLFTQVLNFVIIPFIAFFIGKLIFPEKPHLVMGLLLAGLLPTSGMTISWTGFAKGNMQSAVKMTVFGLILGSVLTPFYIRLLMGKAVSVPILGVLKQIGLVVFIPMILGFITQRVLVKLLGEERYGAGLKKKIPALSTIGVLGVVFIAMALKAKGILADPLILLWLLIPVVVLYLVNFILSTLVARFFFSFYDGIALVYGSVMRNLSIALAIAMTAFGTLGKDIALIIAVSYIVQVQTAAWYLKLSPFLFGIKNKATSKTGAETENAET